MKTKVSLVLMSHLSDVKVEQNLKQPLYRSQIDKRCEFCKWLLMKFPDTNMEIDPDEEYGKFLQMESPTAEVVLRLKRSDVEDMVHILRFESPCYSPLISKLELSLKP